MSVHIHTHTFKHAYTSTSEADSMPKNVEIATKRIDNVGKKGIQGKV